MQLYGYWRSSAAYRVRIAMHLKAIEFDSIAVHLVKNGGEQHHNEYVGLNPTHLVPTLVDGDFKLHQSLAIIDYLEAKSPTPSIYGDDLEQSVKIKAISFDVACEIHPINNLRVQQYLTQELSLDEQQKLNWVHHWMTLGLAAFEQQISECAGIYCFGDKVTLADICLIPQLYNAKRFGVDLTPYKTILRVMNNCEKHPAFIAALPENQPDAQ